MPDGATGGSACTTRTPGRSPRAGLASRSSSGTRPRSPTTTTASSHDYAASPQGRSPHPRPAARPRPCNGVIESRPGPGPGPSPPTFSAATAPRRGHRRKRPATGLGVPPRRHPAQGSNPAEAPARPPNGGTPPPRQPRFPAASHRSRVDARRPPATMLTLRHAKAFPGLRIDAVEPGFTATDLNMFQGTPTADKAPRSLSAWRRWIPTGRPQATSTPQAPSPGKPWFCPETRSAE